MMMGLLGGDLSPSWSMEDTLNPRILLPLLLGGSEEKNHFFGKVCGLSAPLSLALPLSLCPAPCLTPGPNSTTTGPHAVLRAPEIVEFSFAATIYKGLAEPRLGVVEVSDHFGLAGTRIWRL